MEEKNQMPKRNMKVTIHITGFGKFAGVERNPTTLIVEHLMSSMAEGKAVKGAENTTYDCVKSMNILEVSMEAVAQYFDQLSHVINPEVKETRQGETVEEEDEQEIVILLHMGVDASSEAFQIERVAVNEATFRAADQRGNEPWHEPISTQMSKSIDHSLHTEIDAVDLAHKLNHEMQGVKVKKVEHAPATKDPLAATQSRVIADESSDKGCIPIRDTRSDETIVQTSTNAGRFLCNYIYYSSLVFATQQSNSSMRVLPLFVHVPSQNTIRIEDQVQFVDRLLTALYKHVQMY